MLNEIAMGAFAAVHESESGTKRTYAFSLMMSASGGRTDVPRQSVEVSV
jgi:hypothetical protein